MLSDLFLVNGKMDLRVGGTQMIRVVTIGMESIVATQGSQSCEFISNCAEILINW